MLLPLHTQQCAPRCMVVKVMKSLQDRAGVPRDKSLCHDLSELTAVIPAGLPSAC